MSTIKDGGAAFPVVGMAQLGTQEIHAIFQSGMTLRDYFAAKAMEAQVITDMVPGEACDALIDAAEREGRSIELQLAVNSYQIADAMLAAREAQP